MEKKRKINKDATEITASTAGGLLMDEQVNARPNLLLQDELDVQSQFIKVCIKTHI